MIFIQLIDSIEKNMRKSERTKAVPSLLMVKMAAIDLEDGFSHFRSSLCQFVRT